MAIDEIGNTNAVLPTALLSRARPAAAPVSNNGLPSAPAAVAATQEPTPAQQTALQVNEALRALNFVPSPPADILLINETDAIVNQVVATLELTPAQQAALLLNETLQILNFEPSPPTDALLIDETNPAVTTILETQNLTPAQQAALAVNETLQDQTEVPVVGPESTIAIAATPAGGAPQTPTPGPVGTIPVTVTAAGLATGVETPGVNLAASAAVAASTQTTTSTAATTAVTEGLNLTQAGVIPPVVDRNIIATPVYEIRDPKPGPAEPKPTRKDVLPALPIGRVRPVDPLVLRREWERKKEARQEAELLPRPPLAERSIREMVGRANEDLIANGLPLRLVLAKTKEGYILDIYDCSDDEVCRLSQEVPLDLSELLTILDNLQHETGIIINVMT